jgi:hypothetical protein
MKSISFFQQYVSDDISNTYLVSSYARAIIYPLSVAVLAALRRSQTLLQRVHTQKPITGKKLKVSKRSIFSSMLYVLPRGLL